MQLSLSRLGSPVLVRMPIQPVVSWLVLEILACATPTTSPAARTPPSSEVFSDEKEKPRLKTQVEEEYDLPFGCKGEAETLRFSAAAGAGVKSLVGATIYKIKTSVHELSAILHVKPFIILYRGEFVPIVEPGVVVQQGQSIARFTTDSELIVYGVFRCGFPGIKGAPRDAGGAKGLSEWVPRCEDVLTQCAS